MLSMLSIVVLCVLAVGSGHAYPKFEEPEKGFLPSKGGFLQHPHGDQVAMESGYNDSMAAADRPARFGFPTYSTDLQNTNNVVPGLYGPVKLDIGGLVLGTIVGLGAFFLLPKLLTVISNPYGGGYKRSEDGTDQENHLDVSDILSRVDTTLAGYNIDSKACMQKVVCTTVRSAKDRVNSPSGNTLDTVIDTVAKADMTSSWLEGTEWKKAVDVGLNSDSCGIAYSKCPFPVENVVSAVSKYIGVH